jgi:hypothetical protein
MRCSAAQFTELIGAAASLQSYLVLYIYTLNISSTLFIRRLEPTLSVNLRL